MGKVGAINARLRETPFLELGEGRGTSTRWPFTTSRRSSTTSRRQTGHDQVNWVGHSLGGMLIFPVPRALARGAADRQLRGDGEHGHPGRGPAEGHAPRQPRAAAARPVREHRAARPAADVLPLPGPRPDRPVLLHVGERRPADDLAVLRLHSGRPRPLGPAAARPVPRVRPLRLGRPQDRLLGPAAAGHHADAPDRRRERLHVRHPLDRADARRPVEPRQDP